MVTSQTPASDEATQALVIVGQLGAPYGVRGWQHIQSYSQPIDNILEYQHWFVEQKGQWVAFKVEAGRRHGQGLVVKLAGIEARESAALLVNAKIAVKREQFAPLAQDEFYWADLEGLAVQSQNGEPVGKVEYLYENANVPVMVIKSAEKERHVPFVMLDTVLAVDLVSKQMVIDWDLTL
jgi:16S rRNA processing protein RimM